MPSSSSVAAFVVAVALAMPVGAQSSPGVAPVGPGSGDTAPPLTAPAGRVLLPGAWHYQVLMARGDQRMELARRTVRVLPAPGDPSVWLVLEETDSHGRLMADSLLVRRADLRPMSRAATMGPVRMSLSFGQDSVRGAMTAPGGDSLPVSLPSAPGLVASGAMLESLLTIAPLDSGWAATAVQVVPGPAGVALVPVTLRVEAVESVPALDGDHLAWRMSATAADAQQWLWVDRESGRLLRMESMAPQSPDVRYLTVLERSEPGS